MARSINLFGQPATTSCANTPSQRAMRRENRGTLPTLCVLSQLFSAAGLTGMTQYNYADGSRGMQLLTSPRRSVSFARDITTHSLWAFAGEDKVDSSDMTGMLGRFARRMGTEGSVEDRMKTSQMFEDVFEQAGAAEVVAEKKPPPAPTATGGKGKGKAGAKKK